MIKITVTTKELKERAEKIMAHEVVHNCNLAGSSYKIEIGDFSSIDGIDEIEGTILLHQITSGITDQSAVTKVS